jgi:hypothetical protein
MKIKGKDAYLKQIAALPDAILEEVRKSLITSAEEATDLMKRFVPDDPTTPAPDLKTSIGFKFGSDAEESTSSNAANARLAKLDTGLAVTMYAGNERTLVTNKEGERFQNARLQEFGTKEMPANPFFYPAYRFARKRIRDRLARAIRTGAKRAFGK